MTIPIALLTAFVLVGQNVFAQLSPENAGIESTERLSAAGIFD